MTSETICFGPFELDPANYQLRQSGQVVKIERIPMDLLLLLAQRAGQLVTREEILADIWGKGAFLDTDNAVNTAMRKIRRALQEDSDHPRYIETVTGKGYRFVADVRRVSSEPATNPDARARPSTDPPVASAREQKLRPFLNPIGWTWLQPRAQTWLRIRGERAPALRRLQPVAWSRSAAPSPRHPQRLIVSCRSPCRLGRLAGRGDT